MMKLSTMWSISSIASVALTVPARLVGTEAALQARVLGQVQEQPAAHAPAGRSEAQPPARPAPAAVDTGQASVPLTADDLARMENRFQENNQKLLRQLGEARSAQGDRQLTGLAEIIQQMLLEQRQLLRYLTATRPAQGTVDTPAAGAPAAANGADLAYDERGVRPLTAQEIQSLRIDRSGRIFGILDPAGTLSPIGAVPGSQNTAPGTDSTTVVNGQPGTTAGQPQNPAHQPAQNQPPPPNPNDPGVQPRPGVAPQTKAPAPSTTAPAPRTGPSGPK